MPTSHMDSNLTNIEMQLHMDIEKPLTNICKKYQTFLKIGPAGSRDGGEYGLEHCGTYADARC